MYLKQSHRSGRTYLSVCESYRDQGKVRTRTIESLGYADELARQHADPLAFGRQRVRELEAAGRQASQALTVEIARDEQIGPAPSPGISLGWAVALAYLKALGTGAFLRRRIGGDQGLLVARSFDFLTSDRMLHAAPIHGTWRSRGLYPGATPQRFVDVCQALELLAPHKDALVARLNRAYEELRGPRESSVVRLVMSNYSFRAPTGPATGGLDELGQGDLWRLWLSIDGQGMPVGFRICPHDLDAEQVLALVEKARRQAQARSVVLVATELPEPSRVMGQLAAQGDGFVLLLPASSLEADVRRWSSASDGWQATRAGRYLTKSRHRELAEGAQPVREIAFRSAHGKVAEPFCLLSSETGISDRAVFNVYRELWRVHEPFSVISADFVSVPWSLQVREHLEAHFLICYAAFFALRLLRQDMGWRYDAAEVADALCHMEGVALQGQWQLFGYRSPVSDAIEQACGCPQGLRAMRRCDVERAVGSMARAIRAPRSASDS